MGTICPGAAFCFKKHEEPLRAPQPNRHGRHLMKSYKYCNPPSLVIPGPLSLLMHWMNAIYPMEVAGSSWQRFSISRPRLEPVSLQPQGSSQISQKNLEEVRRWKSVLATEMCGNIWAAMSQLRPFVLRNPALQGEIKTAIVKAVDGM